MSESDRPFIEELGIGLGWRGATLIGMTWIYFDESGEHGNGGVLRRLTLGCGIAPLDSWQALSREWNDLLRDEKVPMWHMSDFEARRGPFSDWSDERRKNALNRLLGIAGRNVSLFWGFSDSHSDIIGKGGYRRAYEANVIKALKELNNQLEGLGATPIRVVFAKHKDVSAEWLGRYFDFFSYWFKDKVQFAGFGDPTELPPLQLADLVAYEFSRTARENRPITERYPLLKLAKAANAFTLFHATKLTDRSVWGHPLPDVEQ